MYAIFRMSKRKDGHQGWVVHLSRGGRSIQTTFTDSTYGGREPALFVARAYRDAMLKVVPPMTNNDMRMLLRRNRPAYSLVTGVYYVEGTENRSASWIARIELPGRKLTGCRRSMTRTFNVAKLGYEAAKEAAEAERIRMVQALENGDDPALRSRMAKRLHDRLGNHDASKADGS
ncbi:AP2 domain-containing protein [Consotaella aegiceratis]|uniref:AP2 domain-containing protein n=1 Tax=Consotaella aegiceratis TaxID=3097961 RepID=UPI002F400FA5